MHVPIAEPAVPNAGIGPSPRMSNTLRMRFSTVIVMPSSIGVRASPADRSAVLNMKKIIMPKLNTNMIRRNGNASAFTSGGVDEVEQTRRDEISNGRHDPERDEDRGE